MWIETRNNITYTRLRRQKRRYDSLLLKQIQYLFGYPENSRQQFGLKSTFSYFKLHSIKISDSATLMNIAEEMCH